MGKKKDVSWHSDADVYVGHQVKPEVIFIGGRYYGDSAQIHLTIKEASWLLKRLPLAIRRKNKRKP